MSRLKDLRKYVDAEINIIEDTDKRTGAIVHLYGVSLAATIISKKPGLCDHFNYDPYNRQDVSHKAGEADMVQTSDIRIYIVLYFRCLLGCNA